MKKMNPVVHFEMPAEDRVRMADFYSSAFGWQMTMLGEDMGNRIVCLLDGYREQQGKHSSALHEFF